MSLLARLRGSGVFVLVGLVVAYFVTGKLGLRLAFGHPSATAIWPPTGISLAALLIYGYWAWPAVWIGAFLVNVTTAGSVATSIGIASGNTLEAVVGALLTNKMAKGLDAFERAPDVFRFTICVAVFSTIVSATCGVTSLALGGYADWQNYGSIWLTWWLGDAAGALIVAPLLVLWYRNPASV
jgi:integral membrane sensor domain MASE1